MLRTGCASDSPQSTTMRLRPSRPADLRVVNLYDAVVGESCEGCPCSRRLTIFCVPDNGVSLPAAQHAWAISGA